MHLASCHGQKDDDMTLIGFSTPREPNFLSSLIRKLTKASASHTWFLYHDLDYGASMVMEAHETGFRHISLEQFLKKNKIVEIVEPKHDIDAGVRSVALEYLGRSYDFGGLIGGAIVMLGRWLKRSWNNPLHNDKSLFCSEAIAVALQRANYPGADALVPENTTPGDLLEFIKNGSRNR